MKYNNLKVLTIIIMIPIFSIFGCGNDNSKKLPMGVRLEKMRLKTLKNYTTKANVPKNEKAYANYLLGINSLKNNDEEGAEKFFLIALKIVPFDHNSLYAGYELGKIYEKRYKKSKSDKDYKKVVKTYRYIVDNFSGFNKSGHALHRLALLMADKRDFKSSYQYYKRLLKDYPKFKLIRKIIPAYILVMTNLGKLKEAEEVSKKYSNLYKNNKDKTTLNYKFVVANISFNSDKSKSIELLKEIFKEVPDSDLGKLAKKLIERKK